MQLQPVRKRSASADVFDQIVGNLLDGSLEAGDALPAERSLTETLGVNRQAVREALQRLAQAGLIRIRQGEATTVLDFRRNGTLDLLPRLLARSDGSPDPEVVRSVSEMRVSVGIDAVRLATQRATPEQVTRMEEVIQRMVHEVEAADLARSDLELWDVLIDAADNIAYRLAFNSLRATYEPIVDQVGPVMLDELTEHGSRAAMVEAIRNNDPGGAAAAARALLSKGAAAMSLFMSEMGGR